MRRSSGRSRGRRHRRAAPRTIAASSSATATASFIRPRSGAWSTRRRCSSTTKATCTARGSRTRSRSRRSRAAVARALRLNEPLTEAICLAHDLGHTPFGHAGQDALNDCMREYGGFEHNLQSLRVVDELEERYAEFRGLNSDVRDPRGHPQALLARRTRASSASSGARFLERRQPGLEAQLANLADEIAYNNHDVDDGLRSGLVTLEELRRRRASSRRQHDAVVARYGELPARRLVHEIVRRMIDDVVERPDRANRQRRIAAANPADIEAVRAPARPLIGFSAARDARAPRAEEIPARRGSIATRRCSAARMGAAHGAARAVRGVHGGRRAACRRSTGMPRVAMEARDRARAGRARAVADYIAGMTDRYAILEHARLRSIERPGRRSMT